MRLLWVVPRFGAETVGGAEILVRALATRAIPPGWRSEVATTCARNHETWENELDPGVHTEDGLRVRRFRVGSRDPVRYDQLHGVVLSGEATYADELEWLANSVWAPDLHAFLADERERYDLILFSPYFFGTTVWGVQVDPRRSALVPCLHDEPYARLVTVRRLFDSVRGCIFNSEGERRLAERLHGPHNGSVVGMGFEDSPLPPEIRFAEPRGIGPYVLYAGRIEEGKRVNVAAEYAVRYAQEREGAPCLVLIGRGSYRPPEWARDVVVLAGFVSEEERRAAYREAIALVNPSHMESLSIVLLESWLQGTPALVAAGSDVMREHCEESQAGLLFDSYEEYRDGLDRLLLERSIRQEMGARGREYVLDTYSWPAVRRRFQAAVEALVS